MDNFGKAEILQIIDAVARERSVPKTSLIEAMEDAIQVAGKKKYGLDHNITVNIDTNTGKISLYRIRKVVENLENIAQEILLEDAILIKEDAKIGDDVMELLPPIDLGRVAAQTAKQVITQRVSEVERESQYEIYKDRQGDIMTGTVKRIESGNIIVDIGRAEAILHRSQQIRGERYEIGSRIKSYVQEIKKETKGPQIFLSRTDDRFLKKLFETEVPEIYDNAIEIKAVAREPGSKAKIAVYAADISIDAVGCCVGMRGARVKAITDQLSGEKIDVINWDSNIAQFVINAMTPASISKIVFNEEKKKLETIVPESQLSLAIGARGQNVRLASKLTGWTIDIMTEDQESKRRNEDFINTTKLFIENLDIDEVMAQLLSVEGYNTIEQVAYCDPNTLKSIEGFDENLVDSLKERAMLYLQSQNEKIVEDLEKLGVEQELLDTLELPPEYILKLAEFGIKTIEDLAEVTVEEIAEIVPENIFSKEDVEKLIDKAKTQSSE
ncbi:MAG TPA: transcription termination factor NusA [Candidatus Megaira endosymbiont of Nemacystus decipiens]|nr:transcription termination factor NusA [Candidatus Megaera endosymbiont of Nemacystus decipiens]